MQTDRGRELSVGNGVGAAEPWGLSALVPHAQDHNTSEAQMAVLDAA
jgi:hypothetical protein